MRTPLVASLAFAALALPGVAAAQTFTATVIAIPDVDSSELTLRGINAAHCADSSATIQVRLTTSSGTVPTAVDVWHDGGTASRDCSDATQRSVNTMDRTCVHLGVTNRTVDSGVIEIPISEIAAGDPDNSNGDNVCSSNRASYTFYFFNTTNDPFTGDLGTTGWGKVAVAIDGVSPSAPDVDTSAQTRRGSAPVSITWNSVTPDPTTTETRYQVYSASGCDGDGGTGTRGAAVGGLVGPNVTSRSVSEAGGYVVTTIDASGNESEDTSPLICVELVPTTGFCDVREGGCPSGCSAGSTRAGTTAAVLVFLGLLLARRRKLV
ncbi:MAG: hypothetical protein H6720_04330 [Sandaracinus sp.]|nr:hypothetical protein [Sandaracinus sp.]